jgi:hypothetical protein
MCPNEVGLDALFHVIHPPVPVVYCGYKSKRIEANLTADVLSSVRNHFPKHGAQIWHFDQYFRHRVSLNEIVLWPGV